MPDEPHVSDTLRWILSKRGVYQRAFALLQESRAAASAFRAFSLSPTLLAAIPRWY